MCTVLVKCLKESKKKQEGKNERPKEWEQAKKKMEKETTLEHELHNARTKGQSVGQRPFSTPFSSLSVVNLLHFALVKSSITSLHLILCLPRLPLSFSVDTVIFFVQLMAVQRNRKTKKR